MRVLVAALALSALSFAAGVVGDLARPAPANAGVSVTLRLPPQLPADTVRAAPLPSLVGTASAEAASAPVPASSELVSRPEPVVETEEVIPVSKPRADRVLHGASDKLGPTFKAKRRKD